MNRVPGVAKPAAADPGREVHLLQRSPGPIGVRLRPTTGWVHRAELRRHGVHLHSGVTYEGVGPDVDGDELPDDTSRTASDESDGR